MFVSKKKLRVENDMLKRDNESLSRRVKDLDNAINELTLTYSDFPQLEKAMSFECRTCKYAYKSYYFNYGEAVGCMRKCVCSFYEREEEDEEEDDDNDN